MEGIEAEGGREIVLADAAQELAAAVLHLLADQQLLEAVQRASRRLVEAELRLANDWKRD